VASSAGLSLLLAEGIGDTIRVSITPEPGGDRTEEVAWRSRFSNRSAFGRSCRRSPPARAAAGPQAPTSRNWPATCKTYLRDQMPVWRERHPGVEDLRVAVMGCVVNGPGESKHADVGISLPGHVRGSRGPRIHRRRPGPHSSWRPYRRRVQGDPGLVRGAALPGSSGGSLVSRMGAGIRATTVWSPGLDLPDRWASPTSSGGNLSGVLTRLAEIVRPPCDFHGPSG